MKNSIRVSAKTVDDAITEAIIQLGVTSDQLDYEVIEKGSGGFLGIGMKQAVIEAKKKDSRASSEEKIEKVTFDFKSEKFDKDKGKHKQDHKKGGKPKHKQEKHTKSVNVEEKKEYKKPEVVKENIKDSEIESKEQAPNEIKEKEVVIVEITETTKKEVEKFLVDTLKAMSLEVKVTVSVDKENTLCVDLEGENMGIIIGKRGQTLDSLQYLANRVANKYQDEYIRVRVDTEDYRARRDETLTRLAKNLAHKVKRTRRPVSLEPMNPYERRIIHSVLQSNPHVKTHSEGDEPYRKVVITLKKY
jgi:spoIIIJ-associated protein